MSKKQPTMDEMREEASQVEALDHNFIHDNAEAYSKVLARYLKDGWMAKHYNPERKEGINCPIVGFLIEIEVYTRHELEKE